MKTIGEQVDELFSEPHGVTKGDVFEALQERDRIAYERGIERAERSKYVQNLIKKTREERDRYWNLALNTSLNEVIPDSPESLLIEKAREEERERIKLDFKKHMELDGVSLDRDSHATVSWQADEYQVAMRNAMRLVEPEITKNNM